MFTHLRKRRDHRSIPNQLQFKDRSVLENLQEAGSVCTNRDGIDEKMDTPGKINLEPENTPLEKEKHLPNHHFQVPC